MAKVGVGRLLRAVGKRIGPRSVKQAIWDREHAAGQWDWANDATRPSRQRDIVYEVLDRYSAGLDILDLGCGNGFAGRMISDTFQQYFGVDISSVAVEDARKNFAKDPQRGPKCLFETADVFTFVPPHPFGIIVFSDCLYYFPMYKVKKLLRRYCEHLASGGMFMVRLHDKDRYRDIVEHIERTYQVLEKVVREDSLGVVLVFRPGTRGAGV